jgi:hypothetical protein
MIIALAKYIRSELDEPSLPRDAPGPAQRAER